MADIVYVQKSLLAAIANAIRAKKNLEDILYLDEMDELIQSITTAGSIESLTVTQNGTYAATESVDGYAPVVVNVQPSLTELEAVQNGTYTPGTGYVGYSSVVVSVPAHEATLSQLTASQNGTYTPPAGSDGFSKVIVSVPEGAVTDTITITENGTYTPPSGVDGYNEVVVDVEGGPAATLVSKTVTENGTYDPADDEADGYDSVTVNVPTETPPVSTVVAHTNGVYTAPSGYYGIGQITVDVPQSGYIVGKQITENGNYDASDDDADGYGTVSVNVTPTVIDLNDKSQYRQLPSEYQEVEYLDFTGTQYLTINFAPAAGDAFYVSAMPTNNVTNEQAVLGNNASGQRFEIGFKSSKTYKYFGDTGSYNGNNLSGVDVAAAVGTKYDMAVLVSVKTANVTSFNIGRYGSGAYWFTGRVYKLRVTRTYNGAPTYALYLVPCYRVADDVPGFYDLVSQTFYTNIGTGDLGLGGNISAGGSEIPLAVAATAQLNVSANGTYQVPATLTGYHAVKVNVPTDRRTIGIDLDYVLYFAADYETAAPIVTTGSYTAADETIYAVEEA